MIENHQWLLGVLADLGDYSRNNGMNGLSHHIEQARRVAIGELADRAAFLAAMAKMTHEQNSLYVS